MLIDINPNIPDDDVYDNIFRLCECSNCSQSNNEEKSCNDCFIGRCECKYANTYIINWLSLNDNKIHIVFEKKDSLYDVTVTQNGSNYTITCNRYCNLLEGRNDVIVSTLSLRVELDTILKLIDLYGEYSDSIN